MPMRPEFPGYDVGQHGRMRRREFMLLFIGESVASQRASSNAVAQTYPTRERLSHIAFPPREHYVDNAQTGFTFVDVPLYNAHDSSLDERGEVEMRKRNGPHTKP